MRFLVLCVTLAATGQCYADDCVPRSLVDAYDEDGTPTDVIPWQPQYIDAPSWNIEQGEPPLSISSAVNKALDWIKKKTKRSDIRVLSVSLNSAGCADKWVYWVHFMPSSSGEMPKPSMVVVLMDGTVVGKRVPVVKK